jgi:histidyl-tRNA synthetase
LRRLGVTQWELHLNSIGDANCRPQYVEQLNAWLDAHADVLDEDARHKRATSPLQVFDVKNAHVRAALEDAPKIGESLCEACRRHFDEVRAQLDAYGVPYVIDPVLVRGLDYYSRTTWEFMGPDENANSVLSGGGRYDGLIEQIGGPPTPGVGFGAGIERLMLAIENEGITFEAPKLDVYFVAETDAQRRDVSLAMRDLRAWGIACDADYAGRSMKGQLTQAQRRANTIAIKTDDGWTVRKRGEEDRSGSDLKELL